MVEKDVLEQFKKSEQYSSLLTLFKQVKYNQKIDTINSNTVYIYCNVELPDYDILTKKKVFDYTTSFSVNNPNLFQGTVMFYSKNQYIGCYNDINNVLYLIDIITPIIENNDVSIRILDGIIDVIKEAKEEKIKSIQEDIKVKSKSKIMFADKIYDLTTNDANLSFLDKLLHRIPPGYLHNNDGEIYKVELSDEQSIGLDSYKKELAVKAQKIVADYRQKFFEDTIEFKQRYKEIIESSIPMPRFSPEEIAKSGLMLAVEGDKILYMFRVDIEVNSVIDEERMRYTKLQEPILFNDGLLIITTTLAGAIVDVKFKHKYHHFHTNDDDDVCLGTATSKISNTRLNSFKNILKVKSSIISMMSVCNTASMYSDCYRRSEVLTAIKNAKYGSLRNLVVNSDG